MKFADTEMAPLAKTFIREGDRQKSTRLCHWCSPPLHQV